MTRRSLYMTIGAASLALAIAVPAAFSHGPDWGGDGKAHGRHFDRLAEKLGLDAKQTEQLRTLKQDHLDDVTSIHEQIRAKRDAMKALWLAPSVDKQKILAAEREINALQGQLAESRIDFLLAAKKVLTPEQFKQLVERQRHHGFKRGFKHHRGGRHGFGPDEIDDGEDAPGSPETEP